MMKKHCYGWASALVSIVSFCSQAWAAPAAGVVFIDQMDTLDNWTANDAATMSIVRTDRKTGDTSLFVKYIIDKDDPGTVWFARKNVGIDRAPTAVQLFVNIPQGQRFTWYDFPKLRIILQDKDGTAVYADIDKFASRPVYEGGKSYYNPWAPVLLDKKLFFPLWPGANGTLDGIDTVSFELPHRTEDFMKDGEFTLYIDELSAIFDDADTTIKAGLDAVAAANRQYETDLKSLPAGTWQRYPLATMGVIDLFCGNAAEELKEGKVVRAARQLAYLQKLSAEIGKNLADVKAGKNPYLNVEPARYTNLTVKDGSYFAGDRPVYITGFCGYVGPDYMPKYKQMGFNGFSGGMGMDATLPDANTVRAPEASVAEAKYAADNGLAYDILLGLHGPAGWMYPTWPDLDPSCRRRGSAPDAPLSPKNQYMPWNVDHKGFRDAVAKHLQACAKAMKDIPSLASYDICNEMWYLCHGDFDPNAFRARLEQRYKTIDVLNIAWKSNFKDFASVQFVAGNATSVADLYEYNQYRVTEFFRFCTDAIRQVDPKTPVCGKIHGCWRQMIGIDKAAMMEFFTAADSDVYPRMGNDEEPLVADVWTSSMITHEYRSLAPTKPQIDAEQHMIWYHQIVTDDFITSLLWWRAMLGLDANYAWSWSRQCENFEECIFTQPWAFQAFSKFALDVERLAPTVHSFQTITPDVLVLEAGAKTPDAYRLATYSGVAFDLLPQNALSAEKLKAYRTIVVPTQIKSVLTAETTALLAAAKTAGTTIVELKNDSTLKQLTEAISTKTDRSAIAPISGVVNMPAKDASGKAMAFVLNLNTQAVMITVPAGSIDAISGTPISGTAVTIEPLKPIIVTTK